MNFLLEFTLLILSFLFSGTEAAWRAIDPVRLRHKADKGNRKAKQMLAWAMVHPQADLVLAWSCRACAAASIVLFSLIISKHSHGNLWVILPVTFIVVYSITDVLVRRLFHRLPITILTHLWWLVSLAGSFWAPLARPFARLLKPQSTRLSMGNLSAAEELMSLASTADGISPLELEMLRSVLNFRQLTAGSMALPLEKFACAPAHMTLDEILKNRNLSDAEQTLVIGADDIPLGVMHCGTAALSGALSARAQSFARPLISFPEDLSAWTVLVKLRRARTPVAIVQSNNRRFIGIITEQSAVAQLLGQQV